MTFDLISAAAKTEGMVKPPLPYISYLMPTVEGACDMTGQLGAAQYATLRLCDHAARSVFTPGATGLGSDAGIVSFEQGLESL